MKKKDLINLVIEAEKKREEWHTRLSNFVGESYKKDAKAEATIAELRQQIAALQNKIAPGTEEI